MIRAATLAVALTGCASLEGTLPTAKPGEASGQVLAGAAEVDITPPPGWPMGGHSIEGQDARGVWTRLWARTVVLVDPHGQSLALCIVDLWGMPSGLSDRVAELVATEYAQPQLSRASIVVAATHTHHGPANLATSRMFSRFVGPRPGFDRALFEWTAHRIAASIAAAARSVEPARVRLATASVDDVARNRSLEPWQQNPESVDQRPIDPRLVVVQADALDTARPIATLAVFAMHPTAMANRTPVYSGDVFGGAAARAQTKTGGVVALFNGAEGDVSPAWTVQGRPETTRLGNRLGDAIVAASGAAESIALDRIGVAFGILEVADQPVALPDGSQVRTASRGLPGTATLGGAEDGRTRWATRGYVEGRVARRERLAGQGTKRPPVAPALLKLSLPAEHVPRRVAVGVYRVGPLVLTTLPGELSTVMGQRVRSSVATAIGVPLRDVVALGLAHGHLEYMTTPEEYALQHYEGSSTLYGPYEGLLLAQRSAAIAAGGTADVPEAYRHRPGRERSFRPRARRWSSRRRRSFEADFELADRPSVTFTDAMPTWPAVDPLAPVLPELSIQTRRDGEWIDVDASRDAFVSIVTAVRRGRLQWTAWWLGERAPSVVHRIVVEGLDGRRRCATLTPGEVTVAGDCDAR